MQVTRPCVVSLRWRLEDAQGQLIDELAESMEFLVGGDDLFAKVETALEGQEAGFETDIALQPEEAFGDYDSNLVCFEARALFPKDVEPGMQFEGLPEGAATEGMPAEAVYTVTEVYPEHVVLDGNHPLAGIGLRMHLTLLDVRAATEEEVQAGSVGEPIFMVQTGAPPDEPIH
ncbi:FKBP-type peptidyl-prolyl cis-trans isomerase [Roseateles puraquae]|jgi:FKBP-type peptidyl-prolyl cis-trans isomerase SlyD|uniref:peptidylprolyl isomerase n=1 Tax=Roseateles puraquae TaxID=431059 RepID=A0A254NCP7_9BURK|nr:peptidylprolyl isomerase [Roseateles puraquae]MDG0852714.1 peptidylprolyl isomerase [Roseateles puraquae]OWR05424.1 peptidylprolyl isomerase [Roseateles puraquae]